MIGLLSEAAIIGLFAADVAILAAVLVIAAFLQTGIAMTNPQSLSYDDVSAEYSASRLLRLAFWQVVVAALGCFSSLAALLWTGWASGVLALLVTCIGIALFAILSLSSIYVLGNLRRRGN